MKTTKAFLDTTILTNILIKNGEEKRKAKEALKHYDISELPVYAIKEFKAGPLDYVKYLYNKLLETKSVAGAYIAFSKNYRQRNKSATAVQTLASLQSKFEQLKPDINLEKKYRNSSFGEIMFDSIKDDAKMLLFKAWHKRRKVTSKVVHPLSCYNEIDPFEKKNGEISLVPYICNEPCCLSPEFDDKRFEITKLKTSIDRLPKDLRNKPENKKRVALLHKIGVTPKRKLLNDECRNLGDAVFALFCPKDSEILTTNIKDHKPLAKALDKNAVTPDEVLGRSLKRPKI